MTITKIHEEKRKKEKGKGTGKRKKKKWLYAQLFDSNFIEIFELIWINLF
jgi:hypothetical protein